MTFVRVSPWNIPIAKKDELHSSNAVLLEKVDDLISEAVRSEMFTPDFVNPFRSISYPETVDIFLDAEKNSNDISKPSFVCKYNGNDSKIVDFRTRTGITGRIHPASEYVWFVPVERLNEDGSVKNTERKRKEYKDWVFSSCYPNVLVQIYDYFDGRYRRYYYGNNTVSYTSM
ncbi:hypothetical protein TetV_578 [Tetraselmis virus 1]|uniref:Uncharacterized protein n=1 Tax=Tetraselmis virus 1 TaxID=2060617 RepID=A0A2P0VP70_9VIRU|nr:hypothetical protein QJ968_gp476 [Tetraselmis virus 1]AUF82660.1 hypothetical protein TetV_578 [Tetraselmis virus 1]